MIGEAQLAGIALSAMFGGGLVSLFRVSARNRLDNANSAVALTNAYGKLIDQLEKRSSLLEKRISYLEDRITVLEQENADLRGTYGGTTSAQLSTRRPA